MKCPSCGYENEDSALTCGLCQQKLNKGAGQETPMPAQNIPHRSYSSSVIQEEEKASFGKIDIILTLKESFEFLIKNPIIFVFIMPQLLIVLISQGKMNVLISFIIQLISYFLYFLVISFVGVAKTGISSWDEILSLLFRRLLAVIGNILVLIGCGGVLGFLIGIIGLKNLSNPFFVLMAGILFVFLVLRLFFVYQEIILDEKGPIEAFSESWQLTKGNTLRLALLILILSLPGGILAGILATAFGLNSFLLGNIFGQILAPFFYTAVTLAYLNLT